MNHSPRSQLDEANPACEEVEKAVSERSADTLVFTAEQAPERLEKEGDIFEPVLTLQQELPAVAHADTMMGKQRSVAGRQRVYLPGRVSLMSLDDQLR